MGEIEAHAGVKGDVEEDVIVVAEGLVDEAVVELRDGEGAVFEARVAT